jgi:hypothetical protein
VWSTKPKTFAGTATSPYVVSYVGNYKIDEAGSVWLQRSAWNPEFKPKRQVGGVARTNELENGPRPPAGGEGCFEASIVSWSCASPTRITPGMRSTAKGTSSFNRPKISSQRSGMSPVRSQYNAMDRTRFDAKSRANRKSGAWYRHFSQFGVNSEDGCDWRSNANCVSASFLALFCAL